MKVELPSGAWVEIRTDLKAGDRFAVQAVAIVELGSGAERTKASFLEMQNDMRNALLGRIITGWSYPTPIPSDASVVAAADVVIGNAMDLDDYAALERAVEPLMEKIQGRGAPDPKKRSAA